MSIFISNRGQVAMEMLILFGFLFFVLFGFLIFTGTSLIDNQKRVSQEYIGDVKDAVETEFRIAASADGGYYRRFEIPRTASGIPYFIEFYPARNCNPGSGATPGEYCSNFTTIRFVLNSTSQIFAAEAYISGTVTGNISRGTNEIRKYDNATIWVRNLT